MNREDIIQMAWDACIIDLFNEAPEELERFAALVAAAEREACAKVCEAIPLDASPIALTHLPTIERCAANIRARGQHE